MANTGFSRPAHIQFNGFNRAGSCPLPSVHVGDLVVGIINTLDRRK
jgi:hypothetical protein